MLTTEGTTTWYAASDNSTTSDGWEHQDRRERNRCHTTNSSRGLLRIHFIHIYPDLQRLISFSKKNGKVCQSLFFYTNTVSVLLYGGQHIKQTIGRSGCVALELSDYRIVNS